MVRTKADIEMLLRSLASGRALTNDTTANGLLYEGSTTLMARPFQAEISAASESMTLSLIGCKLMTLMS